MCTSTQKHKVSNIEAICEGFFNLNNSTGKGGALTIKTLKKGVDYTYKVKTSEFEGRVYTHVWIEYQYLKWRHLGYFAGGKIIKKGKAVDGQSAALIGWVLYNAKRKNFDLLNANVEFMHLGTCIRCNRTLTDAKSIAYGMGAHCRGHK